MKVFIVWYDNGEPYEDNCQDIDKIFLTKELAENYLNENYKKIIPDYGNKNPYWVERPYVCSNGISEYEECLNCPKYYDSDCYDGSVFFDEDGNKTDECPELNDVDMNYYSNYSYRIREFEVFENLKIEESNGDLNFYTKYLNQENKLNRYNSDDVELNSKGVNKKITYNLLDDDLMKEIGFHKVDGNDSCWYFCKKLSNTIFDDRDFSITLNVSLPVPINNDNLDISVLDEAYLQPYDFQRILKNNPGNIYAEKIAEEFEKQMNFLENSGVIQGHKIGEYV